MENGHRVSLRYFARWNALSSIATGVLTVGISAIVGAATYSTAIHDAESFFENVWLRAEKYTNQPDKRIVLSKSGFGNYEPQWNAEEKRMMEAQQPEKGKTSVGDSTLSTGAAGMGGAPDVYASSMSQPAGFVRAPAAGGEPYTSSGFGGEFSTAPGQSDIKPIHSPGIIGETLAPSNPTLIDRNLGTQQ